MSGILHDKSFAFALKAIKVYQKIKDNQKEYVLSKQMLRSGTSVGAMVREAEFAQSKPDFISKLSIGLKEANETEYWILLLKHSEYIDNETANELLSNINELKSIMVASIKTAKGL